MTKIIEQKIVDELLSWRIRCLENSKSLKEKHPDYHNSFEEIQSTIWADKADEIEALIKHATGKDIQELVEYMEKDK